MIPKSKREQCRKLRKQGFSLGRIIKVAKLPKTTVWDQIGDIKLNKKAKKYFELNRDKNVLRANKKRKGKCWPGRIVVKPSNWSPELIYVLSHFLFDGTIRRDCCEYYNQGIDQINKMRKNVNFLFKVDSKIYDCKNSVKKLRYSYVELGEYVIKKIKELKRYIKTASMKERKIFLRSFFDDEGCVSVEGNYKSRRIRGYQHSKEILKLIKKLLRDFDIKSRINKTNTEVCISRKINLIKFQKDIDFSPGIYINPNRKNGIWKTKIEKRKILEKAINSYLD